MERVAFLIDATGARVDCLLNPETVQVTRLAGIRPRGAAGGQLTGAGLADDPLVFTGGGRTELVLDLLFDVDFAEGQVRPTDVRVLTRPLWLLAENSATEHGWLRPPLVRLVWGKTWNVPGVIVAVAERFDAFTVTGSPRRSWLRLKLVRVAESADRAQEGFAEELAAAGTPVAAPGTAVVAAGDGAAQPDYSGVRFDLLAHDALGSPLRWRLLAEHNRITDPLTVPAGTALAVPPPTAPAGSPSPAAAGGAP
ncbi:CIS tube protein [Micromonospora sp. LZ34]